MTTPSLSDPERAARLAKVRREVRAGMGAERLDVELLEAELARVEAERDRERDDNIDHARRLNAELVQAHRERDAALSALARVREVLRLKLGLEVA